MFIVGNMFTNEHGNKVTVIAPPAELKIENETKSGKVRKISFEYYYSVQVAVDGRTETYYMSENHIVRDFLQLVEDEEDKHEI